MAGFKTKVTPEIELTIIKQQLWLLNCSQRSRSEGHGRDESVVQWRTCTEERSGPRQELGTTVAPSLFAGEA